VLPAGNRGLPAGVWCSWVKEGFGVASRPCTQFQHRHSRLRRAAARYRKARSAAHPGFDPKPAGLDWMNFFIADVQTGFGTFRRVLSAQLGWVPQAA